MQLLEAFVLQLFILSIISERITNFIKLNLQSLTERLGNFRDQEEDKEKEKERERGIINWAIIIGFLVATLSKTDLFYLIKEGKPHEDWTNLNWIGVFLTGCFLSLGSKFWHDLLDLLLQIKNLKSKLNEQTGVEFSRIEEVDAFLASYELDLVKDVLIERQNEILAIEGVLGVGIKSDKEGYFLEVAVANENVILPQNLVYHYPANRLKFLRTKKILTASIITMNDKLSITGGLEIGAEKTTQISGTLGCLVKYKNSELPVWITCYHVLKSKDQSWDVFDNSKIEQVEQPNDNKNRIIGKIKEAKRNIRLDVAVIEPFADKVQLIPDVNGIGKVSRFRKVVQEDQERHTAVEKYGKTTGKTEGIIDTVGYAADIKYDDGQTHKIYNLIRIKPNDSSKPFSRPGDSGALVVDADNQAIGMIVAGTESGDYSFAIPINTIFNEINLKF